MLGSSSDSSSADVMRLSAEVPSSSASSAPLQPSGECVARSVGSAARYGAKSDSSPRDISVMTASTSASRSSRGEYSWSSASPPRPKATSADPATEPSAVMMAASGTSTRTSPSLMSRVATHPLPVWGNRPMETPFSLTPFFFIHARYARSVSFSGTPASSSASAAAFTFLFGVFAPPDLGVAASPVDDLRFSFIDAIDYSFTRDRLRSRAGRPRCVAIARALLTNFVGSEPTARRNSSQ